MTFLGSGNRIRAHKRKKRLAPLSAQALNVIGAAKQV